MSIDKTIGEVIAEAREQKNLSQRQLAKLAGINSSGLSKIEAGERDPSPKILRKISKHIDVNYNDLMYKMGLGIEVSPLNPFIKDYYSNLKGNELKVISASFNPFALAFKVTVPGVVVERISARLIPHSIGRSLLRM